MNISLTQIANTASRQRISGRVAAIDALYVEGLHLQQHPCAHTAEIQDWCQRAHDLLALLDDAGDVEQIAFWQHLLRPLFMESDFLRRCWEKPRGYAGDFVTIQMMYEEYAQTESVFGRAIDVWAMNQPSPRAVRNRRQLASTFVRQLTSTFDRGPLRVVSLGSGPAFEIFDVMHAADVRVTLVDIDPEALDFVQQRSIECDTVDRITLLHANIIKMVLRNEAELASDKAAFYSLGLIDYFSDQLVVRLLNYMYDKLLPGGQIFLGNFREGHCNTALFKHCLEWPLVLRSEADLLRLVSNSRFADGPISVGSEPEGVQLFIQCSKF